MSKAERIRNYLSDTDMTRDQIALAIGCRVEYVRVVEQRLLGGGGMSVADRRYRAVRREAWNAYQRVLKQKLRMNARASA